MTITMNELSKTLIRIVLWTILAYIVLAVPVFFVFGYNGWLSVTLGYGLALINIISGYLSIRLGFGKSVTLFLGVVMGGMAFRFILLGTSLYLLMQYTRVPLLGFLASFMIFYLFLQYHEIKFVNDELKAKK